jgi:hypothetical protein
MVSSFSSSSLTVESVPLLNPTFEQPEDGTELFSCRVKTGLWNGDRVRVDNDGVLWWKSSREEEVDRRVVRVEGKVQQVQQGTRLTHERR